MTTSFLTAGPQTASPPVRVALIGRAGELDAVAGLLPRRWSVRTYPSWYAARGCDLLVIADATPAIVAEARALRRTVPVIAVIGANAPVDDLVALLDSGVDACVRAGEPAILAGHLLSCHRRQHQPAVLRAATRPIRLRLRYLPSADHADQGAMVRGA